MHLLILDNRLQNKQTIINSVLENVEVLLLDYENDTFETIHDKKKSNSYDSVAIMQHSTEGDTFQFTQNNQFDLLDDDELINLGTFFMDFDSPIIDLLQCALMTRIEWKSALTTLESTTGLNVRASDDNTGNLKVGGNWILESDNVNIKDLYFTEGIEGWEGVLTTDPDWAQLGIDIDGEASGDQLGLSVSLSSDGSIVAIGANSNDGNGANSGHVRVYQWNGSNNWIQMGADIDGEASGDQSGYSVSLSSDGSIVAIGANLNDGNGNSSGHVRVYQWNGSAWVQLGQDIDGEASDNQSGRSVSLSSDGSIVAIGAISNNGSGTESGHVRVYQWNGSNNWIQMGADIDGEASGDYLGWSVSLSSDGSIVAIGANLNDGNGANSGHVRVYQWNGSNNWIQMGADIDGEASGDFLGNSVSLSSDGSIVAIGSLYNDGNGNDSGHVRVHKWNGSNNWIQMGADIDGEASGDQSGYSVSLSSDGSIVAIGAIRNGGNGANSGHVRVYQWNGSNNWIQMGADIDGEVSGDYLGWSVSLSSDGSIVAIGAIRNDGNGANSGHVRVFSYGGAQPGDGGGGNDLTLVSHLPADGSSNILPTAQIKLTFSSDVSGTNDTSGSIFITPNNGTRKQFSTKENSDDITINGSVVLINPGKLNLVTTYIVDICANAFVGFNTDISFSFTTVSLINKIVQEVAQNKEKSNNKDAADDRLNGETAIGTFSNSQVRTSLNHISEQLTQELRKQFSQTALTKAKGGFSLAEMRDSSNENAKKAQRRTQAALQSVLNRLPIDEKLPASEYEAVIPDLSSVAIFETYIPNRSQEIHRSNLLTLEEALNTSWDVFTEYIINEGQTHFYPIYDNLAHLGGYSTSNAVYKVNRLSDTSYNLFYKSIHSDSSGGEFIQFKSTIHWLSLNWTQVGDTWTFGQLYEVQQEVNGTKKNGCIFFKDAGGNGGLGGGGGGDPYLYPALSNIPVKLPNKESFYRLFENNNNDVFINASITQATEEHQQRMLNFAQSKTLKTHNIICDGYFFDAFHVISEGNSLHIDLKNKKVTFNANTENYFTIKTKKNTTYKCNAFNGYCNKVYISWTNEETGRGYKLATNFFSNPHVENGIELLSADYKGAIGCLVRNYKPKLMELPNVSVGKYKKLHRKLNKAKSKFQTKQIKGKNEVWHYGKK